MLSTLVGQSDDRRTEWRQCMHFARWVTNTTDTHSKYVVLNCLSTAATVRRKHLNIMSYWPSLACLKGDHLLNTYSWRTLFLFTNQIREVKTQLSICKLTSELSLKIYISWMWQKYQIFAVFETVGCVWTHLLQPVCMHVTSYHIFRTQSSLKPTCPSYWLER
jgi:hypothetical protein